MSRKVVENNFYSSQSLLLLIPSKNHLSMMEEKKELSFTAKDDAAKGSRMILFRSGVGMNELSNAELEKYLFEGIHGNIT